MCTLHLTIIDLAYVCSKLRNLRQMSRTNNYITLYLRELHAARIERDGGGVRLFWLIRINVLSSLHHMNYHYMINNFDSNTTTTTENGHNC